MQLTNPQFTYKSTELVNNENYYNTFIFLVANQIFFFITKKNVMTQEHDHLTQKKNVFEKNVCTFSKLIFVLYLNKNAYKTCKKYGENIKREVKNFILCIYCVFCLRWCTNNLQRKLHIGGYFNLLYSLLHFLALHFVRKQFSLKALKWFIVMVLLT